MTLNQRETEALLKSSLTALETGIITLDELWVKKEINPAEVTKALREMRTARAALLAEVG